MFLTEISESDILTIYDRVKFKCRTFIESINLLFTMGSELEQEVDTIETSVGTSADEASSSGSLWARVKYALANMVKTSDNQTIAGVKTFSSSPVVPTTPDTTTSAVNQAYVESTVDGVNNLVHKSGNETIVGSKVFIDRVEMMDKYTIVVPYDTTTSHWYKIWGINFTNQAARMIRTRLYGDWGSNYVDIDMNVFENKIEILDYKSNINFSLDNIKIALKVVDGRHYIDVYIQSPQPIRYGARLLSATTYGNELIMANQNFEYGDQTPYDSITGYDNVYSAIMATGVIS